MIKIKVKKVIIRGEKKLQITGLSAMKEVELPAEYMATEGARVYQTAMYDSTPRLFVSGNSITGYVDINEILSEEKMNVVLAACYAAGERLRGINIILAEKNAGWEGEETFCV